MNTNTSPIPSHELDFDFTPAKGQKPAKLKVVGIDRLNGKKHSYMIRGFTAELLWQYITETTKSQAQ